MRLQRLFFHMRYKANPISMCLQSRKQHRRTYGLVYFIFIRLIRLCQLLCFLKCEKCKPLFNNRQYQTRYRNQSAECTKCNCNNLSNTCLFDVNKGRFWIWKNTLSSGLNHILLLKREEFAQAVKIIQSERAVKHVLLTAISTRNPISASRAIATRMESKIHLTAVTK
jgi:hypothetical protein